MANSKDAEVPGVIRGTINGKAKYCRIPVRSKLFDVVMDSPALDANMILDMPRADAIRIIDAIMEDWIYWMRRAGEYYVRLTAQDHRRAGLTAEKALAAVESVYVLAPDERTEVFKALIQEAVTA